MWSGLDILDIWSGGHQVWSDHPLTLDILSSGQRITSICEVMMNSIRRRLTNIEKVNSTADGGFIAVFQDLDDRDTYHIGSRDSDEVMSWPDIDARYEGWTVFKVDYVDNWRCEDDI
jgi:hypothetical protein